MRKGRGRENGRKGWERGRESRKGGGERGNGRIEGRGGGGENNMTEWGGGEFKTRVATNSKGVLGRGRGGHYALCVMRIAVDKSGFMFCCRFMICLLLPWAILLSSFYALNYWWRLMESAICEGTPEILMVFSVF